MRKSNQNLLFHKQNWLKITESFAGCCCCCGWRCPRCTTLWIRVKMTFTGIIDYLHHCLNTTIFAVTSTLIYNTTIKVINASLRKWMHIVWSFRIVVNWLSGRKDCRWFCDAVFVKIFCSFTAWLFLTLLSNEVNIVSICCSSPIKGHWWIYKDTRYIFTWRPSRQKCLLLWLEEILTSSYTSRYRIFHRRHSIIPINAVAS